MAKALLLTLMNGTYQACDDTCMINHGVDRSKSYSDTATVSGELCISSMAQHSTAWQSIGLRSAA